MKLADPADQAEKDREHAQKMLAELDTLEKNTEAMRGPPQPARHKCT